MNGLGRDETMRPDVVRARRAHLADAETVGRILGRAFIDDPLLRHMLPDPALRPEKLPKVFSILFKICEPNGGCLVTAGAEAAAIWLPPDKVNIPITAYLSHLGGFLDAFGVSGAVRALSAMDQVDKAHPHEPHWYLLAVGAAPEHQGKGHGSRVIREQLRRADSERIPAYLETGTEKNVAIYRNLGFEAVREIPITKGPTLTGMWREPQP